MAREVLGGINLEHNRDDAGYGAFCDEARIVLEHEARRLRTNASDRLSSLKSHWHPNGFAVFPINTHHKLGNLRLHIWPDATRTTRPNAAPIHTHVWHLCSRILVGTYTETLYEKPEEKSLGVDQYHSATIDYLNDKDSVTASHPTFLRPIHTSQSNSGDFHTVPADVPHETHIAEGSFVATLMLSSHPVSKKVTMYSPVKIPTSNYARPVLTPEQKIELVGRLDRELTVHTGDQN